MDESYISCVCDELMFIFMELNQQVDSVLRNVRFKEQRTLCGDPCVSPAILFSMFRDKYYN